MATTIYKKEKCKLKFESLVKKAKEIEAKIKRCIDFIDSSNYEEFTINTNKYYLTM